MSENEQAYITIYQQGAQIAELEAQVARLQADNANLCEAAQ